MQVELYNNNGEKTGFVDLKDDIFGIEPNENAMHQAVVTYLAHQRQGTAKTKVRSEVSGGGKKPWRQKGRGTARSGSSRSPVWVGGGTIHGPQPHTYDLKITKKMKRLARKSALSLRCSEDSITVVEDFTLDTIKTATMHQVLTNLKLSDEKVLVLMPQEDEKVYLSTRNIPNISIFPAEKISTYDILNHRKLLIFKGALEKIEETFAI
jgi:large subunit ribosomal protein L4